MMVPINLIPWEITSKIALFIALKILSTPTYLGRAVTDLTTYLGDLRKGTASYGICIFNRNNLFRNDKSCSIR